jgi:hypothetical protein
VTAIDAGEQGALPLDGAAFAGSARVLRPGGPLLAAFFKAADEPVTAYGDPGDGLAAVAGEAEVGLMSRAPAERTRFRRGRRLLRRR